MPVRHYLFLGELVDCHRQLVLDLPLELQHRLVVLLLRERDLLVLITVRIIALFELFDDID